MEFKIFCDRTNYSSSKILCSECPVFFDLNELFYEYKIFYNYNINIWFICNSCVKTYPTSKYGKIQVRYKDGVFIAYAKDKDTHYVIEQYKKYSLLM